MNINCLIFYRFTINIKDLWCKKLPVVGKFLFI